MATTLAESVTSRAANESVILTGLNELSFLLLSLREVASAARDHLLQSERPLLVLIDHPARVVRLAACQCLWALVLAFPTQLAGALQSSLNRVRSEHAKLSSGSGKTAEATLATLSAQAAAVCKTPATHALVGLGGRVG